MPNVISPKDLNEDFHDSVGMNRLYSDYKPSNIPSRVHEEVAVSKDQTTIKLIDKNQKDTLSFIEGKFKEYYGKEYFEIVYTWSKNERQGYLTYLFEILIYDMNLIILSDREHTSPGSKEFWSTHIKRNKFEIYRYDIESNYKRNAKNYKEDEIWGLTSKEKDNLEKQKQEFHKFENYIPEDIFEDNLESPIELGEDNDLLSQFDYEIEEAPEIIAYKKFMENYSELKNTKEKIRLIAQKIA